MAKTSFDDFLMSCWFQVFDIPELSSPPTFLPYHMAMQPVAGFNAVTFPGITGTTEEIKELVWPYSHKILINAYVDPVVLRRGMTSVDLDFYTWMTSALHGVFKPRRNLMIYQMDSAKYARRVWVLYNCIPQSYRAPDLDAFTASIAIPELTLEVGHVTETPLGPGFQLA